MAKKNNAFKYFYFLILNFSFLILQSCEIMHNYEIENLENNFIQNQSYFYNLALDTINNTIINNDSILIKKLNMEVSSNLGLNKGYYIYKFCYKDKYNTFHIVKGNEITKGYILIENIQFMNCLMSNYKANLIKNKDIQLRIKQINDNWLCYVYSRSGFFKEIEDIYNCE